MIWSVPQFSPAVRLGTKVPQPLASLGGHEGPVVLLEREGVPGEAYRAIRQPVAEEFTSRSPFQGRDL